MLFCATQVATNAADKDNEVRLSTPRPSLGRTTESEKAVPQSDAVDLRTELGEGRGRNEDLPLGSGGAAEDDVDQRKGSRGQRESNDSCSKAESSAYGSSVYEIASSEEPRESSSGEPREPATLDEGEDQHGREGNGIPLSPSGNGTTLLSRNVEIPAGADGVGTAKDTPGKAPVQPRQQQNLAKTGGEGDYERDGTDPVLPPKTGSIEPPAGVPCATLTAITNAAPIPKSTTTASGNHIAERLNSCSGSAVVVATEPGEQRAGKELEESGGSLEGDSAHSRWSLPESRGIGGIGAAGGLHEQRAIWAGGQEDDSVGFIEQAPSSVESESGGPGEDGKPLSRSRVESYDLQQETVRGSRTKKTACVSSSTNQAEEIRADAIQSHTAVSSLVVASRVRFACRPACLQVFDVQDRHTSTAFSLLRPPVARTSHAGEHTLERFRGSKGWRARQITLRALHISARFRVKHLFLDTFL